MSVNNIKSKKFCCVYFFKICYHFYVEQKPGWNYRFIDSLGMYIAINEKTGVMYTEDKIKYTEEECRWLERNDFQIPLQVHLIKKVFSGEIVGNTYSY